MNELKKGKIDFDGIVISGLDSLTDVLQKTINIKKEIQNRENHQFIFIQNNLFCNTFTHSCFIFSESGRLEKVILCFTMGDERNRDKKIFEDFLRISHIKDEYHFKNGMVKLVYDPHFREYSIEVIYLC